MASADTGDGGGGVHIVQVMASNEEASSDEISPLLVEAGSKPSKMTIFSVSYPKKKPPKEATLRVVETEVNLLSQIILWVWSGSKYSGLLCMASSSTIYYFMEVLIDIFPVRSIPLFETIFTRCTITLILSFVWLRTTGQPIFVPTKIRNLLITRSLTGFLSLMSFIYSVQNLPLSYALVLNFATPIMASVVARIIFQEKLTLSDIGGLACSFLGLLFISLPTLSMKGGLSGEMNNLTSVRGSHPIFPILIGIFSSTMGGISYCLIRAGAKSSDQPVYTVFAFGLLACPISAICSFTLQEFVLPNFFAFSLMIVFGVLAFFAEISFARGLQLEKTSKATNILFIKVLLSQVWSMTFLGTGRSYSKLLGCLLILISVCSTVYFGPDKEIE